MPSLAAYPFVEGCLKQYIVNDALAIAFAGVQEGFQSVSAKLLSSRSQQEAVEIAHDAQSHGQRFDLLVAEAGRDTLCVVSKGTTSESSVGWIGDASAFAAFQRYYQAPESPSRSEPEVGRACIKFLRLPEPVLDDEPYPRLYDAFKRVVSDSCFPSVGGVVVPLCTDQGRFRYMNYADVTSDPLNLAGFIGAPERIEFGTAMAGGYSVEFLDDAALGGDGKDVGFYFLQGGFGVVFPPDANGLRKAKLVIAPNPAHWVLQTRKFGGHGIASSYMTEDHCGTAGEELLQAGANEDALYCYELRKDSKTLPERPDIHDRYFAGYATAMFNSGDPARAIAMLTDLLQKQSTFGRCREMLFKMVAALGQ
jgi:hypothetical protein